MTSRRFFRLPWRTAKQIRADVDDELTFHIDERVDALVALGYSPDAARAQALREFGDIDDARRYIGAVDRHIEAAQRRSDLMNDLRQDIVYALRKLRGAPLFTLTAVVTLALGIGATTAIFSVVNGVLLKPLPFPQQERIMRIRFTQRGTGDASTPPDLVDFRTNSTSFEGFASYDNYTANLVRDGADPERVPGYRVSANWFALFRVKPLHGRFFAAGEDTESAAPVVVLSEPLWRRDFAADPAIVGAQVRINAQLVTVIGIAPAGLGYPMSAELWVPQRFSARELSDAGRGARWLALLGRVKDDVPPAVAAQEVDRIERMMETRFPEEFRERRAEAVELRSFIVGDMRKPLLVMMGAVVLVLLIACAIVANLLLVRAASRVSELAIRAALGAGRTRLIRQLVTESVILSLVGAVAGTLLAQWGMAALLGMAPDLPRVKTVGIDGFTLAVTAGLSVCVGLLFGVLPALQSGGVDVATALRAGTRGTRTRRETTAMKRFIVAAEVALAVTLLTGAGLLIRSFRELMAVDTGFKPDHVVTMKVLLPERTYDSVSKVRAFGQQLEERMRAIPGVRVAAYGNAVPLDGSSFWLTFTVRGRPSVRQSDQPAAAIRTVSPNYFEALGIPVVRGRAISADDRAGAPRVVVVNSAFVKKHMADEEPLGRYLELGWSIDGERQGGTIIGVVGDTREDAVEQSAPPEVYLPAVQTPIESITMVARTSIDPAAVTHALRDVVKQLDPSLPVYGVQTMSERIAVSVSRQRFYALLLGLFAAIALALAAVGLYGVIAYAVGQRTHELGVRVALGATGERITRMVIGEGLAMTAVGAAVGVVASIAGSRVLASLLFNVKAADPITFGSVVVVLALVAAVASWLPARRAARVDPLIAMRGD
jgi:predicted permease